MRGRVNRRTRPLFGRAWGRAFCGRRLDAAFGVELLVAGEEEDVSLLLSVVEATVLFVCEQWRW